MAYAVIAGLDPRYGLYTAVVMTALGSLFGSSSHLMNGPTNAISLVVFSAIAGLGALDAGQKTEAVFLLALLVGMIQIVIALFKLGDLTRYVSESVIIGFMTGAGILVGLSQVPNLLGLRNVGDGHQHLLHRIWLSLSTGGPVPPGAVAIGVGTAAVVIICCGSIERRLERAAAGHAHRPRAGFGGGGSVRLAGDLATISRGPASAARAGHRHRLDSVPSAAARQCRRRCSACWRALAVAKSIAARRTRQTVDYNRQCLAEGLANLGGGLFQCMPGSGFAVAAPRRSTIKPAPIAEFPVFSVPQPSPW